MGDFDLDLRAVEEQLDEEEMEGDRRVVLGILDGTTPDDEWVSLVDDGNVLVLNVDGDVNERASGFAREVRDAGGHLMHFRGFLVVTPPEIDVDASRV